MTKTLLLTALLLALVAAPLAAAEPHGPPPGYTDPTVYAADYVDDQVSGAAADPVAYASGKAAGDNLTAEAEHSAWLACWSAWYATGVSDPACAMFFTAPVSVTAPVEQQGEATVEEVTDDATALADELADAVNDTLADPTTAVEQVQRIVNAALGFVLGLVDTVLDLLGLGGMSILGGGLGALEGLLGLAGLGLDGLQLAAGGLGDVLALTGDGMVLGANAIGDGALAAVDAVVAAVLATGHGMSVGAGAVGGGIADAADATVSAVTDAVDATGHAISEVASGVVHAVASLFDGREASQAAQDPTGLLDAPDAGKESRSLVEKVLDLL